MGRKGLATFSGGVHPYEGKELSKDKALTALLPKGELVYPLSQHIGAPAVAQVSVGDRVLVGQTIGAAGGFVSAPVICSVSGMVKKIEPRVVASGSLVDSIVVENDGQYEAVEGYGKKDDPASLDREEIQNRIKNAGLVGLGGAGFPTIVKLMPKEPEKIDHIIVNGAECEPYITSDYRLMLERGEEIVEGLSIVLFLFDHAKGVIAIEDNKPEAIRHLGDLAEDTKIEVLPLKTKYPQGGERMLIYSVTGRKVNSSMLPADAGCIVINAATAIAIYEAVAWNMPLTERVITVTGEAVKNPSNFLVKTGTDFRELVDAAGGFKERPEKLIAGGPMMGTALFTLDVPVTKTSSSLLAMSKDQVAAHEPTHCIHCGRCVKACPEHLIPQLMYRYSQNGDMASFEKIGGMECIECGCCAYGCPAKLPLTQTFRLSKRTVTANRRKKA